MGNRILVVDDEESTAFLLGESLAELGPAYQIETAFSGEEAVYKIAVQPFDLVITDLRMPGLSGLELLKWIRKASPGTRLILMTAYGTSEVETQARHLEVYRYITKPFRVEDLLDAARQALGGLVMNQEGMLAFSDATFEAITHRLERLRVEIEAHCLLLADIAGQLVTHAGAVCELPADTLMSLLGGGFAATFEMARLLGQETAFNLNYQEGANYDVYTSNVGRHLFLTIVYKKAMTVSRIGLVWLYTRRAISDLLAITSTAERSRTNDLVSADFGASLQHELDAAFNEEGGDLQALTMALEQESQPASTPPAPIRPAPIPSTPARPAAPGAPASRDHAAVTYSLEEAYRMGLISEDLLQQMLARRSDGSHA